MRSKAELWFINEESACAKAGFPLGCGRAQGRLRCRAGDRGACYRRLVAGDRLVTV